MNSTRGFRRMLCVYAGIRAGSYARRPFTKVLQEINATWDGITTMLLILTYQIYELVSFLLCNAWIITTTTLKTSTTDLLPDYNDYYSLLLEVWNTRADVSASTFRAGIGALFCAGSARVVALIISCKKCQYVPRRILLTGVLIVN